MLAQNKSLIKFSLCFKLFSIKLGYQYIDKRCKDKRYLPFDFKIDLNNEVYIIEYDGRQHY